MTINWDMIGNLIALMGVMITALCALMGIFAWIVRTTIRSEIDRVRLAVREEYVTKVECSAIRRDCPGRAACVDRHGS